MPLNLLPSQSPPESPLCPYKAMQAALKEYFQFNIKWVPLTDSRIRKTLARINVAMGYHSHHFTFHSFQHSITTFAYISLIFGSKISSIMAPGHQAASERIFSKVIDKVSILQKHLLQ